MDDTVYHYTSMSALMGIVTHGKLWCTSLGCLNDTKEWSHAFSTAIVDAKEFMENKTPIVSDCDLDRQEKWLAGFVRECERFEKIDPVGLTYFVASFSEKGDDLSQWRAYGSGGGACIGFSRQRIEELTDGLPCRFDSCEYRPERQSAFLQNMMFDILTRYGNDDSVSFAQSHAFAPQRINSEFAAYFKHAAFAEEAEWRLSMSADARLAKFRVSRGGGVIVPYHEFDLKLPQKRRVYHYDSTPCVITECIVGPGDHQGLAVSALENFLWANGINVPVAPSKVPWRQSH